MRNTAPPALFKETAGSVQCGFTGEGIYCNLPQNRFSLTYASPYASVCFAVDMVGNQAVFIKRKRERKRERKRLEGGKTREAE